MCSCEKWNGWVHGLDNFYTSGRYLEVNLCPLSAGRNRRSIKLIHTCTCCSVLTVESYQNQ